MGDKLQNSSKAGGKGNRQESRIKVICLALAHSDPDGDSAQCHYWKHLFQLPYRLELLFVAGCMINFSSFLTHNAA